jgi:hypothetical protein
MKRLVIYWPLPAVILSAALAFPLTAQQPVPFKGAFHAKDCVVPENTGCSTVNSFNVNTSGSGTGTHLGEFSLTQQTDLGTLEGSGHWAAANGDTIDTKFTSFADFTTQSLGYVTITETHTITGGTGRFAVAQGNFILERTHLVELSADGTHITFGSFRGSITLH